jgi:LysM repeat protein
MVMVGVVVALVMALSPGKAAYADSSYLVRPSDTLSSIARAHGTTVQALLIANPGIRDPNRIFVGQVLSLHGHVHHAPVHHHPPAVTTYVVKSGDTLSSIARLYGTTVADLMTVNKLTTTTIFPGQILVVAAPRQAPPLVTHTVMAGDTLASIARHYGTTVEALVMHNRIHDPTRLVIGQVIVIADLVHLGPGPNRANCAVIRGTPYLSVDERLWYLYRCL